MRVGVRDGDGDAVGINVVVHVRLGVEVGRHVPVPVHVHVGNIVCVPVIVWVGDMEIVCVVVDVEFDVAVSRSIAMHNSMARNVPRDMSKKSMPPVVMKRMH